MKNGSIKDVEKKLLSDNWYTLNKYTFSYQKPDGTWEKQEREAYDRGNGAAILLYNSKKKTVVLTRQFRMPTYVNGNEDGMMIEVCAGLLDGDNPADCVRKETEEETGYKISNVQKVFQTYMSPGSVTEIVYLFVGEYDESMKVSDGGGADDETENIEVLELDFNEAMKMVASGEIKDAKTIMLLQHAKLNSLV
ncbi:nudix-type nucleoside diphosphatase, YffH/AdpP family [Maribacter aquivivus]|uniref:GDP-mannose pyrophosphatase n=1 Tax=Maribacter aquivivus TaxID=228958 RepID=A0A1M6RQ04_9FLAO|nr:GDP-mannose pyrophosphatase NudK [Maribacter aquivivus]SHK34523.1 nudix-type nucleoside diphosphatase, YffH/AdpP family [Maribacter aquivivus]